METPFALVARSPEDMLACVPVSLGFVPEESVVMLCLGDGPAPHARVDLGAPEHLAEVCAALVEPARRHGVDRVVLSLWTSRLDRAGRVGAALVAAFGAAGIGVVAVLAHDGRAWAAVTPPGHGPATPFDVLAHPFVADAVLRGRVVLGSRSALTDLLQPVPERVAATARALRDADPPEASEVGSTVGDLVLGGRAPTPLEVARLLHAARRADLRDALWSRVPRSRARRHVDLWLAVVRAAPTTWRSAPAALVAALAWRAGDGALAWCAVEASRDAPGRCPLADLVADLLDRAVHPGAALVEGVLAGEDHHAGGAA